VADGEDLLGFVGDRVYVVSALRGRGEIGMTAIELVVATSVLGLALAAFYTSFYGFFRDVGVQDQLTTAARSTRPVMRSLVIELRQAVTATDDTNDPVVTEMAWDRITFHSDRDTRTPNLGPEKYSYQLINCSNNACQLRQQVTAPDSGSGPNYTYTGTPVTEIVLTNVVASASSSGGQPGPLFSARTPPTGTTSSCSSTTCDFPIVVIDLRMDPNLTQQAPRMFELHEEVRLRNAR
jgi:type II secretory pathway pseudopilin PulG